MIKAIGLLGLALGVLLSAVVPTQADTIFQSAQLPPGWPGVGDTPNGAALEADQLQGVRFTTTQDLVITGLGIRAGIYDGYGNDMLFLALTPLASPSAFPNSPTLSDAIFHGLFHPQKHFGPVTVAASDTMLTTNFLLPAGSYSLIAGSGLFGATGFGFAPKNNVNGSTKQFFYYDPANRWWQNGFQNDPSLNLRFFVEGHPVAPEPGSLVLLAMGGLPLLGFLRRR